MSDVTQIENISFVSRSSGNGLVVTCCRLENLSVGVDAEDFPASTAARRLSVFHDGQDGMSPGLFMSESKPRKLEQGVFVQLLKHRTSVDIWFENQKALDLAFGKVSRTISLAKSHRGQLLRDYLLQQAQGGEDSSLETREGEDERNLECPDD